MDKTTPWSYFKRSEEAGICNICLKKIKAVGGSTSGLHSHLKTHNINLLKREPGNSETNLIDENVKHSSNSNSKITNYFNPIVDNSFSVASRLTALDGLPFSKFCTSEDLRKVVTGECYKEILKSKSQIKNIVIEYSEKICKKVIDDIAKKI